MIFIISMDFKRIIREEIDNQLDVYKGDVISRITGGGIPISRESAALVIKKILTADRGNTFKFKETINLSDLSMRNKIRFDIFWDELQKIKTSSQLGFTWEGIFAGLFGGEVIGGSGKVDVKTNAIGYSVKWTKDNRPVLGQLKDTWDNLKPKDSEESVYDILKNSDKTKDGFKRELLKDGFSGVNWWIFGIFDGDNKSIKVYYVKNDKLINDIIVDPTIIDAPKSLGGGPRLKNAYVTNLSNFLIKFPKVTKDDYKEYSNNVPREKEINKSFGGRLDPDLVRHIRKNPKRLINKLYKIYGDKLFDWLPQRR